MPELKREEVRLGILLDDLGYLAVRVSEHENNRTPEEIQLLVRATTSLGLKTTAVRHGLPLEVARKKVMEDGREITEVVPMEFFIHGTTVPVAEDFVAQQGAALSKTAELFTATDPTIAYHYAKNSEAQSKQQGSEACFVIMAVPSSVMKVLKGQKAYITESITTVADREVSRIGGNYRNPQQIKFQPKARELLMLNAQFVRIKQSSQDRLD